MALSLHSLRFKNPDASALVILHGLLGSSRNWTMIGKALRNHFDVHALDLRNHGRSPHSEVMRWEAMVKDLKAYLDRNDIGKTILMGHSFGGKVAMRFACEYPRIVEKLIIVDIAAKAYPPYYDDEFRAMKRIVVGELFSRKEAEQLLEPFVPEWAMRQFLLTNLVCDETTDTFKWQVNLECLHTSLPYIRQNSLRETDRFDGPTLLVRGGKSNFINDEDVQEMVHWFSHLREVILSKAGHNVHIEDREGFLERLTGWL